MSDPKVPAAVVYLERPDGRVLALTRGQDFGDWHLPGGKWEPLDGVLVPDGDPQTLANLAATAIREVWEETGLRLHRDHLRQVATYTTRSGRPVTLFLAGHPPWAPERFGVNAQGDQPAWVPPPILTLAWASFAYEAGLALAAVARDRQAARGFVPEDLP